MKCFVIAIVCGIRNKKTQQRLLQEADLTYSKAYDLALAAETAQKNSDRLDQSMRLATLKEVDGKDAIHRVWGDKTPRNHEGRAERVLLVITCVSTVVGDTHTPSTGTKNIYVTITRRKAI